MADVPDQDVHEGWIFSSGVDGRRVANDPDRDAGKPKLETKPQRGRERAIDDGDRCAARQPSGWLGERAVKRELIAFDAHGTSAPPPKEKKDRKNEVAAKAIDRPKTILDQSPEPSGRFPEGEGQTGDHDDDHGDDARHRPSMDSRIAVSGASHGIPEPAAYAGLAARIVAQMQSQRRCGRNGEVCQNSRSSPSNVGDEAEGHERPEPVSHRFR
ncbi:MAG: hypothetical protein AcusKO_42310 [Acuticoccus sp.]